MFSIQSVVDEKLAGLATIAFIDHPVAIEIFGMDKLKRNEKLLDYFTAYFKLCTISKCYRVFSFYERGLVVGAIVFKNIHQVPTFAERFSSGFGTLLFSIGAHSLLQIIKLNKFIDSQCVLNCRSYSMNLLFISQRQQRRKRASYALTQILKDVNFRLVLICYSNFERSFFEKYGFTLKETIKDPLGIPCHVMVSG